MAHLGTLLAGRLIRRDNRFRATVIVGDEPQSAHVPNSGRLGELLTPGAAVYLRPAARPGRVTAFDLALVERRGCLVCIDARLPPRLIREAWAAHTLPTLAAYDSVVTEVAQGESRLDLRFVSSTGATCWVEAKSVTLVRDGVAGFPDAPTERGRRHVAELATLAREGYGAMVFFVIQREDAVAFGPNDQTDPAFGAALRLAREAGVQVAAHGCRVTSEEITLADPLPLRL